MRSSFQRLRFALGVVATVGAALLGSARAAAQGGEPQYFAIRGATVVPVSGPREVGGCEREPPSPPEGAGAEGTPTSVKASMKPG